MGGGLKLSDKKQWIGLIFVSPWILGFLLFTIFPLLTTVVYSFCTVRFKLKGIEMTFVNMKNYTDVLFKDPGFKLALPKYFVDLFCFVPMVLVFSIMLSLLLNTKLKGRRFFRALFFLPVIIISGPVVENLQVMGAAGLPGLGKFPIYKFIHDSIPNFIAAPILYVFDNVVLILWYTGVQTLIFLSAMQKIDRSIYEASMVDGASNWQCFWKIIIPTIKPFIFLNAVYTIVDVSMSALNPIITEIKKGMFDIKKGFGFASAASWIYFIIILLAILLSYLLFGRERE